MSVKERALKEKKDVEHVKKLLVKKLCESYHEQRTLKDIINDESERHKFIKLVENEMKTSFNLIRIYVSGYRGGKHFF